MLLARAAGYLEWIDPFNPGIRVLNPVTEAQQWLHQIHDICLTLDGRDRARGRVIQRQLSDPDEDDGRPIRRMTLEEIARAIDDTYTGSQLPRYLRESGIPEEFIPAEVTGSKWEYVLGIFEALHDGGSAARRALRESSAAGSRADITHRRGQRSESGSPPCSRRKAGTCARAGSQSASGLETRMLMRRLDAAQVRVADRT